MWTRRPVRTRKVGENPGIVVFDAQTEEEIRQIGARAASLGHGGLMAGCAGFASILPDLLGLERQAVEETRLEEKLFVICGSVNPITKRQLECAALAGFPRVYMTPEEKQEYDAYMEELSNRMFLDVYMREIGGNCYMLVQIYSGDQAGNAALLLSQMQPYAGGGWSYTDAGGWQYHHGDGTFGTNEWALDENGLTYRLDGNGQIMYKAWIEENGRWKYVDEFGHMVTNLTKTIDGSQYTFDAQGYMVEGSQRPAQAYETGTISGKTYSNRWANLFMKFPEAAELMLGDGSYYSYPLEAGENMYYWYDGGTGYLLTIDYTDSTQQLDRYLEWLIDYAGYYDYTVDSTGTVNMGGYEYKYIKTSGQNSDGTTEHEDTYFRQIDGKLMEISIEYTGDRQATIDQILSAIEQAR